MLLLYFAMSHTLNSSTRSRHFLFTILRKLFKFPFFLPTGIKLGDPDLVMLNGYIVPKALINEIH
jgi:hypothetical protein